MWKEIWEPPNKAIWKTENLNKHVVVFLAFRLWFKHHFDSVCDYLYFTQWQNNKQSQQQSPGVYRAEIKTFILSY